MFRSHGIYFNKYIHQKPLKNWGKKTPKNKNKELVLKTFN